MELLLQIFFVILLAVVGGLPCLYMVFSLPGVLGWKIYRKCKYGISFWD